MRVPGVCRDPASAYDMHGFEGLGAMLGVETDRIDHGEGLFDGLENRSVIVHIGADRFESGSLVREHSPASFRMTRSEEHTFELQSQSNLVCRLLLEKKKQHYQHEKNETKTKCKKLSASTTK